jgi:integrase
LTEGARLLAPDGIDSDSDRLYYLATKLAFLTGLRIGEVCGLLVGDIKSKTYQRGDDSVTMYYLDVSRQYNRKLKRLTPTKDKEQRAVPIMPQLYAEIETLLTAPPDTFLFSFHPAKSQPITANRLNEWLQRRLDSLGISDRRERNITFHSGRRFFNTLLRRRVSGDVLRKMTGHDSDEMTEHYTDYLPDDLAAISEAQQALLTEKT